MSRIRLLAYVVCVPVRLEIIARHVAKEAKVLIEADWFPAGARRWKDWRESLPQTVRQALRFDNDATRQVQQAVCNWLLASVMTELCLGRLVALRRCEVDEPTALFLRQKIVNRAAERSSRVASALVEMEIQRIEFQWRLETALRRKARRDTCRTVMPVVIPGDAVRSRI